MSGQPLVDAAVVLALAVTLRALSARQARRRPRREDTPRSPRTRWLTSS